MGAPLGNKNATKTKVWEEALRKALAQYEAEGIERGQALNKIAERVVRNALDGDKDSWVEIGNRMDGKPAQAVDLGSDPDRPVLQKIVREIVRTQNKDG